MSREEEEMDLEVDIQNPFGCCQCDGVPVDLFASESEHMPCYLSLHSDDLRLRIRRSALSLIYQSKFSYDLDPFLVYLAANYVDRFLSKQEIREERSWIAHILVLASLSLAAKMRKFDLSDLLSDLQREVGLEFDSQSVQRMETILLASLQWRMRSITPFSFLQYFVSLLELEDAAQCVKNRACDIIFNVQHELKLLQYKPSTVAASALVCAIQDLNKSDGFSSSEATICSSEYVNKQTLLECFTVMQKAARDDNEQTGNGTPGPTDIRRTNSRTREEGIERDNVEERRRRRLNGVCDDRTFQISQVQYC
ncbi:putative cyclin-D6-1 [Andrographis paniculata]|uniref:putative cyclin-D6-1 n=1 Tax=Andrographis paniculata TaxID=175694 RepID=UPI0021E9A79E|nr:putative cyclin-D6-1 [Andrographis paniculata]